MEPFQIAAVAFSVGALGAAIVDLIRKFVRDKKELLVINEAVLSLPHLKIEAEVSKAKQIMAEASKVEAEARLIRAQAVATQAEARLRQLQIFDDLELAIAENSENEADVKKALANLSEILERLRAKGVEISIAPSRSIGEIFIQAVPTIEGTENE